MPANEVLYHKGKKMRQITEEKIGEVVDALESMGQNPLEKLFEKMDGEQHCVTDYLFEVEGEEFNEDERDLLISFTTLGWHIIRELTGRDHRVSDDELSERLERNAEMLESREKEVGDFEEALLSLINDEEGEPFLMNFLMNLLVDRPAEYGGDIRDQSVPVILVHLKTIMDCLLAGDLH